MPKGAYPHRGGPRVSRAQIVCSICSRVVSMVPGAARQRTGLYCSKSCEGAGRRKPDRYADVTCGICSKPVHKRKDHLKAINYCSRACSAAAKRIEGAKWRDAATIKQYMRDYAVRNRERLVERAREWVAKNPEKRKAIRQAWAHSNREWSAANAATRGLAKRAPDAATYQDWLAVLEAHSGQCAYCGATERIECDHIVPIAKGGRHIKSNIQPLCRSCNSAKGAKVP